MKAIHRLFAMFLSVCVGVSALAAGVGAHEVKFVGGQFAVDGRAVQIRAGEIEPQRIPREYWSHRIKMCKAMGLNAISSYFMWNDFEQSDGSFDFKTGNRDVAAFLSLCKEEGMWVLFRPGPYCCGEWDFGGLPPRLLKEDIAVRTMDARYLMEAEKYLSAIADIAEPFLAKNGGPIVLTQIENEYGSWPFKDVKYLLWVKDFWKKRGFGPFYMADGAGDKFLKDLIYPDPEIAVGFDPAMNENDWSFAKKYNPGVPVLSAETYPGWLRHWGEGKWEPSDITKSVRWFMEGRRSFCFFVAHGGTSFGFTAGANDGGEGGYEPDLTSYDYGAPIDEQGRPTKAYFEYRKIISDALGVEPPPVPDEIPSMAFDAVVPSFYANIRDSVAQEIETDRPLYFEKMDQNQGMAFYRTSIPAGDAAELTYDRIADYAQVWLDGKRIATIDRRRRKMPISIPKRGKSAALEIVVEAMGHINFGKGMKYDRKGIVGDVYLDGKPLANWRTALKPLSEESVAKAKASDGRDGFSGGHFRAVVKLDKTADTFIDVSKWKKGTVYVNGRNIGRYWNVGPQLSLYCPAPFLVCGENTIDIMELELSEPQSIRGLAHPLYLDSGISTKNAANEWGDSFSRYRFDAGENAPVLLYDAYRPIEDGGGAEVAVVLIHGWGGHVRTVLPAFAKALAARAGSPEKTPYVIAPQFPRRETMASNHEPDDGRAVWCDSWANESRNPTQMGLASDDWRGGGDANGTRYSSFDYIDAIFARFADRKRYPNLRKVVLAGFSAGGQFVGRYVATGKGVVCDGVKVEYVAMSPSTELLFEPGQPWLYGLKGRPRYSETLTEAEIMRNLCSRRVWRGCGSQDVLGRPRTSLDMTPPAVMQGANRFERFRNFERYVCKYPEWRKQVSFHVFEGVGHKEDICYADPALLDFIFERN